jgi:hypothetical protein
LFINHGCKDNIINYKFQSFFRKILYLCIVKPFKWVKNEKKYHFIDRIDDAIVYIWTIVCFPLEESGRGLGKGPAKDRV